ncbi:hypothetical protein LSAT2_028639 [Lamellibrachia satsuma]|nr:hypothetical protein LSAT2_028639 [Lamellibrachia satsuma]
MKSMSLAVLCVTLSVCGASTDPGVKIRFSRRGLDFVSNAALDVVATSLTNASVGDQHVTTGKSKYDMTRVRITSFTKPTAVTVMAPGSGITWKLSGGAISVIGNWHYMYHGNWLLQANDRGTFDVSVFGFDISISIEIGMDKTGQPTIRTTGCSSDVRRVNVRLHGDQAWLYNMFDGQVETFVKTQLRAKLCEVTQQTINTNGAKRMKQLNLQLNVAKWLVMDDRLVRPPKFTNNYVESFHKGEAFGFGSYKECPLQPMPLPDEPLGGASMMTFWISDYALNTLGYVIQRSDLMHYNLTNKELAKKGKPNLLDTTCPGKVCLGNFIPGLSKQFPNSSVSIKMMSSGEADQPRFTMLHGQLQGHLAGMAYFSVKTRNGTEVPLLKARLNLVVAMDVHLSEKRLKTTMSNLRIKTKFVHANFGVAAEQKLETFFTQIADICVKPKLDASLKRRTYRCASGHGAVRQCAVRHGAVRHGAVRHGAVRHGAVRHGAVRHGAVRHGAVRHGAVRHGAVRHGAVRHDTVRFRPDLSVCG